MDPRYVHDENDQVVGIELADLPGFMLQVVPVHDRHTIPAAVAEKEVAAARARVEAYEADQARLQEASS